MAAQGDDMEFGGLVVVVVEWAFLFGGQVLWQTARTGGGGDLNMGFWWYLNGRFFWGGQVLWQTVCAVRLWGLWFVV